MSKLPRVDVAQDVHGPVREDLTSLLGQVRNLFAQVKRFAIRFYVAAAITGVIGGVVGFFGASFIDHREERAAALREAQAAVAPLDRALYELVITHLSGPIAGESSLSLEDRRAIVQAADELFAVIDSVDQTVPEIALATAEYEAAVSQLRNAARSADTTSIEGVTQIRRAVRIYGDAQENYESAIEAYLDSFIRRNLN